jgi:hypothetical protein
MRAGACGLPPCGCPIAWCALPSLAAPVLTCVTRRVPLPSVALRVVCRHPQLHHLPPPPPCPPPRRWEAFLQRHVWIPALPQYK